MQTAFSSDPSIQEFWLLKTTGVNNKPGQSDNEKAVQYFPETIKKKNGRYSVRWSWRQWNPNLPNNYGFVLGQPKFIISRL